MDFRDFIASTIMVAVLSGCSSGESHYGIPDEPPPKPHRVPIPPPPPPAPPVTVMSYAKITGADAVKLLQGDQLALRFLTLRMLAEDRIISVHDLEIRVSANKGALLPLTQEAPATGLDIAIPDASHIVDALKMLPPQSEAFELLVDSVLPAVPRARKPLAPFTKIAARRLIDRLDRLDATGLISPEEHQTELDALYALLNSDRIPETDVKPPPTPPPPTKPKPKKGHGGRDDGPLHHGKTQDYVPDPENFAPPPVSGKTAQAGLFLLEIPEPAQIDKAATMIRTQYPELAPLGLVTVKTDLGDVGITWRLVAGPVSPDEARNLCEALKAKKQECTPIAFPANGTKVNPVTTPTTPKAAPMSEPTMAPK